MTVHVVICLLVNIPEVKKKLYTYSNSRHRLFVLVSVAIVAAVAVVVASPVGAAVGVAVRPLTLVPGAHATAAPVLGTPTVALAG